MRVRGCPNATPAALDDWKALYSAGKLPASRLAAGCDPAASSPGKSTTAGRPGFDPLLIGVDALQSVSRVASVLHGLAANQSKLTEIRGNHQQHAEEICNTPPPVSRRQRIDI